MPWGKAHSASQKGVGGQSGCKSLNEGGKGADRRSNLRGEE